MADLDVDFLFTNIPLDKIIDICNDSLYNDNGNIPKIPKDVFQNLVNVAPKDLFFLFNKFYKQTDGIAMGSQLWPGAATADSFMCNFKHKWLKDCPGGFKPFLCGQYFDYILVLFSSVHYAEKFKNYLPFKHPNISFSLVKEKDGCLSLLEINIFPEKAKIITYTYRKKTFSGVYTIISVDYTAISISVPETNETGLIKSFLFQCFSFKICEIPSWNKYIKKFSV